MAGFFGLFNYEKEGPGISKNAPRKKTFVVFFETFFRNFWKFITINLLYVLISIPVVTNGIASVGITNVTRNIARDKHSFGVSDFIDTIKRNWKQALPLGIINVIIYVVMAFDIYFFYVGTKGLMSSIGLGICLCLLFIYSVMNFYISTMMITFKFSLKQIFKNSFRFVFINMKWNLLCLLILLVNYALYVLIFFLFPYYIVITLEIILFICCFPSFRFLLVQFFTFPSIKKYIIDPYYEAHPDEDVEKRESLGIEVVKEPTPEAEDENSEETEEEPENVFEDN